ncbi:glycoside hydrolase family 28 protein [Anaerotalea alkaliphila]|uniref:Glycoside hydrolase family 28 protein n=1 Tax=Anaerotalea alkaliphila TaxID=2662126 RepID=A0A7X5HUU1_9FIRM|nr:glycosyl hydrolase family 28 protein [Anaerotalea alkaliphila]NDL67071.1 glycoside hydrolase family 28 protein [Anaerotalea alkaliphila]
MIYSVLDTGAVGDGQTNDAPAIQKAIDACHEAGGGRVLLESGRTYYASSIELKGNVDLHIGKGAVLKAHSDIGTYIRPNGEGVADKEKRVGNPVTGKPSYAFIYAKDAHNITISGEGAIDGNAYAFVKRVSPYYVTGDFYPRPTLVYTEHCNHSTFTGVTMRNAPFWTLHPAGSDDVAIHGLRILNDLDVANSDGIDPDHCTNVRISGCHITCADDCICLKTTVGNREYGPTRNVVITNCTLVSTSAAIKIGTEGVDDFENVLVDNCIITGSNRGISIQVRDGGNVRNVSFSNIIIETRRFSGDWWGCAEPIVITAHDRDAQTKSGSVSRVRFQNITCDGENGIFISGNENTPIKDLAFEKIRVTLRSKSKWPKGFYDLRPIPDGNGILEQKSSPIFLRHVDGVEMKDVRTSISEDDRSLFSEEGSCEHCENVSGKVWRG